MSSEKSKPEGGFLSRWSRLKAGEALPVAKPVLEVSPSTPATIPQVTPQPVSSNSPIGAGFKVNAVEVPASREVPDASPTELPAIESLNRESDFTPFMAKDVPPGLRNLAMKKLFTDPHYNVMDRLDIYIDDYGTPDPIPPEMLRMLTQSKSLRLFDEDDPEEAAARALRQQIVRDQEAGIGVQSGVPSGVQTIKQDKGAVLPKPELSAVDTQSVIDSADVEESLNLSDAKAELIEVKVQGVSKP
jgi:Protein of unknown function (DUF3306)